MSASVTTVGALSLGGINLAATAAIGIVAPLIVQYDLTLFGAFGLGPLQADISAQFTAALDLQIGLAASISDPFASITALANLLASLQLSLPTISLDVTSALSANIAISSALAIKLGGIQALIEAALAVKLPATQFFTNLAASLSAGPVFLLNFTSDLPSGGLSAAGAAIHAQFAAGLVDGSDFITASEPVYGIILLTKDPAVFVSLGAVLKTA